MALYNHADGGPSVGLVIVTEAWVVTVESLDATHIYAEAEGLV